MTTTKKQLIAKLRAREDMTWDQATRVVNSLFDIIGNEVSAGNDVYIPKFGRFYPASVARKRCKHPVTKEYIIMPEHPVVRFRMAEHLRRKLNR